MMEEEEEEEVWVEEVAVGEEAVVEAEREEEEEDSHKGKEKEGTCKAEEEDPHTEVKESCLGVRLEVDPLCRPMQATLAPARHSLPAPTHSSIGCRRCLPHRSTLPRRHRHSRVHQCPPDRRLPQFPG